MVSTIKTSVAHPRWQLISQVGKSQRIYRRDERDRGVWLYGIDRKATINARSARHVPSVPARRGGVAHTS